MTDEAVMKLAVAVAREGIASGQSPFGAVIVQGDRAVATAHNTVWRDTDPTAHAEVNAIRRAAAALGTIALRGCVMYTTCEPCPMCLAACHWAKLDRVVHGCGIADAAAAGFSELRLPAATLVWQGGSPLALTCGVCEDECRHLFQEWLESGRAKSY
jgi:tRNA(Arg) A34 adenosine deaminase TadA